MAIENITENASVESINETVDVINNISNPELTTSNESSSLFKTLLNLLLEKISFIKGEIIKINAQLNYENSSPVSNKPIDFYLNETNIGQSNTNEQGMAEMDLNTSLLEPGVYLVGVDYKGDESLEKSHNSAEITINEAEETVENTNDTEEIIIETPQEAELTNSIDNKVKKIEDCIDVFYNEEEPVYEKVSYKINITVCDDEPLNLSCHIDEKEVTKSVFKEIKTVQKIKKQCTTKGYTVKDIIKLNTERYTCSAQEEDENIIIICDSEYDGNGDGICTPGESCMKFAIDKNNDIKQYEKNSRNDFVEEDKSYFLEKVSSEVLK